MRRVMEDAVDRRPVLAGRSHSLLDCALLSDTIPNYVVGRGTSLIVAACA
jgi:hypothetical protein